jgi:hypothetical protein
MDLYIVTKVIFIILPQVVLNSPAANPGPERERFWAHVLCWSDFIHTRINSMPLLRVATEKPGSQPKCFLGFYPEACAIGGCVFLEPMD